MARKTRDAWIAFCDKTIQGPFPDPRIFTDVTENLYAVVTLKGDRLRYVMHEVQKLHTHPRDFLVSGIASLQIQRLRNFYENLHENLKRQEELRRRGGDRRRPSSSSRTSRVTTSRQRPSITTEEQFRLVAIIYDKANYELVQQMTGAAKQHKGRTPSASSASSTSTSGACCMACRRSIQR